MNLNKISEQIKEFGNKDNELIIIGFISILLGLWIILYLIPNIFVNLFNTILGKVILVLFLILVSFKNLYYGMILLFIFVITYRFLTLSLYSSLNHLFWFNHSLLWLYLLLNLSFYKKCKGLKITFLCK
jgi:hypothetical protein